MGYAMLVATCFACGRIFSCNPHKVPSYNNQPICKDCIHRVNEVRRQKGRQLWPISRDAYEPIEETAL